MGRGKDFDRGGDRFEEQEAAPVFDSRPPMRAAPRRDRDPAPSGPTQNATVKWFKADKGFGFVELADGSGDAFLHASKLEHLGATEIAPNMVLSVRVGPGPKGQQVTEVTAIDAAPPGAAPPHVNHNRDGGHRDGGSHRDGGHRDFGHDRPAQSASGNRQTGVVKFFNTEKGFGFIQPDDGGRDFFVHISAVERAGMSTLREGQALEFDVVTERGKVKAEGLRAL